MDRFNKIVEIFRDDSNKLSVGCCSPITDIEYLSYETEISCFNKIIAIFNDYLYEFGYSISDKDFTFGNRMLINIIIDSFTVIARMFNDDTNIIGLFCIKYDFGEHELNELVHAMIRTNNFNCFKTLMLYSGLDLGYGKQPIIEWLKNPHNSSNLFCIKVDNNLEIQKSFLLY